ncbi:Uncharacterised protein [Klebsiella michiganensis]|nr:Uncharacterised protein [Klebsiella michiganensis]
MLNIIVSAAFKNVQITDQVSVSISERVFQGVANSCLRGKMNDPCKFFFRKKPGNSFPVCQIYFVKNEIRGF